MRLLVPDKLILGLGRHTGTEAPGVGASPGSQYLFSSLEQSLRRNHDVACVPAYYYTMDPRRSLRIAFDLLDQVNACLFGLPPHPLDLDPFFLVRSRMRRRIPFVYFPLGDFPRGAWFYRHVYRYLGPDDLLMFSSRADLAIHDALVSSTPARTVVVPFGVRIADFRKARSTRATTRRQLGLVADNVVFVYHGRVTAEKNVHAAIMLFRSLARDHPGAQLWVIGSQPGEYARGPGPIAISALAAGPLSNVFKALVRGTRVEKRVLFWGAVSREALPLILGAADVGLNLTLNEDENFGYGVVEAMACGLPVIGTDWGGLKDTIIDGITGFRVPTIVTSTGIALDRWQGAQRARELLDSPELRARMGREAARHAAREFSLNKFTQAVAHETTVQITRANTAGLQRTVHAWSALGTQLANRYCTRPTQETGLLVASPIPLGRFRFRNHPIMHELLRYYATRSQTATLSTGAIYFLATELISLHGTRVRSKDPRYAIESMPTNRADRAILGLIGSLGFCNYPTLRHKLTGHVDPNSISASLRRLLRAGVILNAIPAVSPAAILEENDAASRRDTCGPTPLF